MMIKRHSARVVGRRDVHQRLELLGFFMPMDFGNIDAWSQD
jgi:hypothetical protein